ncbi:GNAT family N-acetyltransferase [Planotetraspora thailandica]|uniref:GNAT family N-acetyltransferase n=1 Tax=Planotetraspora thailandica TaxID=487172 RepID=UPI00194FA902|nr:GNAT family N-acetyltransferase [Planotetraspora thailandica]
MADRQSITNGDGTPVISYEEGVRDGLPWADNLEVHAPGAADLVMSRLRGWIVSAPEELSGELIARGARLVRHAHVMTCDLAGRAASGVLPPSGFRFVPCDRAPEEVFPAWLAAYPPGHPDHRRRDADDGLREELTPLMRGEKLGTLHPSSTLAVDAEDKVVAGVLINDWQGTAWISEVFRHPDTSPSGLGAAVLATALDKAAADGLPAVGLAVTHTNPARRVYERLGFTVVQTSVTVTV